MIRLLLAVLGACITITACGRAEPTLLPPKNDPVYIDSAELVQSDSMPVEVELRVAGELPTPCHRFESEIVGPSAEGVIDVHAYSVSEGEEGCASTLQPFEQTIPIGSFTSGSYVIRLNDEAVGEVGLGESTGDADKGTTDMQRGPVFVDETELLIMESYPIQVALILRGSLPTPCHTLSWSVEPADSQGRILVEAWSLSDPSLDCIQVIQAMEERVPLGSYSEGSYEVWLNGEQVSEFDSP